MFDNEVTAPSIFPDPEPFAKTPSVGAPICVVFPTVLMLLISLSTYAFVAASVELDGAEPNVT